MKRPTTGRRLRRSRDAWRKLLDEQAASGLSQKSFCATHDLPLSSFCNAKRRAAQTSPPTPERLTDFVPLELTGVGGTDAVAHADNAWEVELALFDGVVLRMRRR